jgi:hypothetical protein
VIEHVVCRETHPSLIELPDVFTRRCDAPRFLHVRIRRSMDEYDEWNAT